MRATEIGPGEVKGNLEEKFYENLQVKPHENHLENHQLNPLENRQENPQKIMKEPPDVIQASFTTNRVEAMTTVKPSKPL